MEHEAAGQPINLVLPVLTKQDVVHLVAGILSGQISLSMSSVEPLLVLANAVEVSHIVLQTVIQQLCRSSTASELYCVNCLLLCSLSHWRQLVWNSSVVKLSTWTPVDC